MRISMKEITRAINENQFLPKGHWEYESIELIRTRDTCYGKMDQYEIIVRVRPDGNGNNAIKYQINHYVDEEAYACFWNGCCFI